MKKLLITGASGFVGHNLIQYCEKHAMKAIPVSLRLGVPENLKIEVDAVIHLAGKAHDLKNVSAPEEYFTINAELTKTLFDQFLLSEASTFVFLSSVKASADFVEGNLTERDVPNPITAYGQSKLLAENYLLSRKLPEGKRLYILRPCMIHGPGNKGNFNLLYSLVKKRIPYPLAAFENKRSFLSVENLCFIICELVKRTDILSGLYNVADDKPLSTNEVVKIIASEFAQKARLVKLNKTFIRMLAKIGDKFGLPLNTQRLEKLTQNYVVDNNKLKDALKLPLPVDSELGIRLSVRSFGG